MQIELLATKVKYGRASAREWLLWWLATHGPTPKHAVVAAYRQYCWAVPAQQAKKRLEQAFHRAKLAGLVTGDKAGWQGPSVWRLCEPGEQPRLWLRRPGNEWRPRNLRMVWQPNGGFHFDYPWPKGCSRPPSGVG
jgi:hypothetical protein